MRTLGRARRLVAAISALLIIGAALTACFSPDRSTGTPAGAAGTNPEAPATATVPGASPTCGAPATLIHEIQGVGHRSELVGRTVTIEGVVVGDFQTNDGDRYGTNLGGYFVQEEDADADDDPRTSEGIYVADSRIDVALGDLVRVTGTVIETNSLTHLNRVGEVEVCATGVALPSPAVIEFPLNDVEELEAYEGMLVTFPQELVISEYYDFDRYGEVVLAWPEEGRSRLYQPTSLYRHDDPRSGAALADLELRRIVLDDGIADQNPRVSRHPSGELFSRTHLFRGGDVVRDLTGILDERFGSYRVQPVLGAEYLPVNSRPPRPDDVGGSVRAGVFNVLNYFVNTTARGRVCGPWGDMECRGADDAAELQRQRTKIVAALSKLDAHAVGLVEIENDGTHAALADLVEGLNDAAGAGTYAYVDAGGAVGSDAIKVAIVYQPAVLAPVGAPAVLTAPEFLDPTGSGADRNRAALAQTFEETATGGRFTLVVNHFKSKGSPCSERGEGGLQGNCNLTRTLAAKALLAWLETDPTGGGDPDFLLVGDFNSYALEEPTLALLAGPDGRPGTADDYTDLLREFVGEEAYTYVFDGMLGYLDYALASATLAPQVTGTTVWHINADEPDILDYDMTFKKAPQAALYSPDPFRSSDHDPILVGLSLTPDD